jgi:hypothetical protein
MRRVISSLILGIAVIALASVGAQTPSFAGKWTVVPDPNAPTGRGFGGLGQAATITQDATSLTITRTTQMGEFTSTYKLDGSESKNTITVQGNTIDQLSKLKWDGGTLTISTSMSFDGNPVQTTTKLSLDAAGNLVVESTRPDFQGGGAPITTKMTYKKEA